MTANFSRRSRPRGWRIPGLVAAVFVFSLSGCVLAPSPVRIDSNPPGALVTVAGHPVGTTPTQWQPQESDSYTYVGVSYNLPGYFPENLTYNPGTTSPPIFVTLQPSRVTRMFEIASSPAGAGITIEGRTIGVTPALVSVEFIRASRTAPWSTHRVSVSKPDHETETFVLTEAMTSIPVLTLARLKERRVYRIAAVNRAGKPLSANVSLDGKPVGKTPCDLTITYGRANKHEPWPVHQLAVEEPGRSKPVQLELGHESETKITVPLEAIAEIHARIVSPEVVMTGAGAALELRERSAVATLHTADESREITELKQVTRLERQDRRPENRVETINSFTITPDGRHVVFALTEADDSGNGFSSLYLKRADESLGGTSRLTQGTRYFDTQPYIANDGSNYLVFASNRGDRAKPDIFRVNLVENQLAGGISRLTSDNRLNYGPTYGDSNRELFYVSIEPSFPKAEPQISSVRFDGSLPTQLPVAGEQLSNAYPDRIYFVRTDSDTGKQQIYSVTADGRLETELINQEEFKRANCSNPMPSADGQRVLFVSDYTADPADRAQNDIYLINADGTELQRLTYNASDDTLPVWSPTEDNVVFFRSTRGGATNIWRFKLGATRR